MYYKFKAEIEGHNLKGSSSRDVDRIVRETLCNYIKGFSVKILDLNIERDLEATLSDMSVRYNSIESAIRSAAPAMMESEDKSVRELGRMFHDWLS